MRVAFRRSDNGRTVAWTILGEHAKRAPVEGTHMAAGHPDRIPHDLGQFVVEAALGMRWGFWGCVAGGASFRSLKQRKRTDHGKGVIRAHLADLDAAESAANHHVDARHRGEPTELRARLDEVMASWRATPADEPLVLEWPSGRIVDRVGSEH